VACCCTSQIKQQYSRSTPPAGADGARWRPPPAAMLCVCWATDAGATIPMAICRVCGRHATAVAGRWWRGMEKYSMVGLLLFSCEEKVCRQREPVVKPVAQGRGGALSLEELVGTDAEAGATCKQVLEILVPSDGLDRERQTVEVSKTPFFESSIRRNSSNTGPNLRFSAASSPTDIWCSSWGL
jgi:hypothetical protein